MNDFPAGIFKILQNFVKILYDLNFLLKKSIPSRKIFQLGSYPIGN